MEGWCLSSCEVSLDSCVRKTNDVPDIPFLGSFILVFDMSRSQPTKKVRNTKRGNLFLNGESFEPTICF